MPNTKQDLLSAADLLESVAALGFDSEQIREARLCLALAAEGLPLRQIAGILSCNLGKDYNRQTVLNRINWAVRRASEP